MVNNAVLAIGIQQSDSVIPTHKYPFLFQIPFQFRLLQNNERSSLCYRVGACLSSLLHIAVYTCQSQGASQVELAVKNSPAMQETQETRLRFLGPEDPLEEGVATHSSILAWKILWTEEPGRLQAMNLQRVRHD